MNDPRPRTGPRGIYRPSKSRFWHYDFVVKGVRHCGSTETADEEQALSYARSKKQELKSTATTLTEMRLEDAAARFQAEHRTDDLPTYKNHCVARVVEILGPATLLSRIDTGMVRLLLSVLENERRTVQTILLYRSILRGILDRAVEWDVATRPVAWWRLRMKKPAPCTRTPQGWELQAIRQVVDPDAFDAFELSWRTGLRRSELVRLTWDCVDWDAGTITYVSGKGKRVVELPIVGGLRSLLERRWGRHPAYVLTRTQKRHFARGEIRYAPGDQVPWQAEDLAARLRAAVRKLGLSRLTLHDLRRGYGTIGTRTTKDLRLVGKTMGHNDFSTTERAYAHVLDSEEREALARAEAARDSILANATRGPGGPSGSSAPRGPAVKPTARLKVLPPRSASKKGRG